MLPVVWTVRVADIEQGSVQSRHVVLWHCDRESYRAVRGSAALNIAGWRSIVLTTRDQVVRVERGPAQGDREEGEGKQAGCEHSEEENNEKSEIVKRREVPPTASSADCHI